MEFNKKNFHIKILDSKSQNYLVTIAIGKKVINTWQKFVKNNWIKYKNYTGQKIWAEVKISSRENDYKMKSKLIFCHR